MNPAHAPSRRILLISFHYGPQAETGGFRWTQLVPALIEHGWTFDIIAHGAEHGENTRSSPGGTALPEEIHPIAIRYPGVEPCIPIRLTRIAATEDMAIRAFFLGQQRVVPQNWPHVVLNWAKFDWLGPVAPSYDALVSAAVDEAGGRAFVTEYAGTDAVVSAAGISSALWQSEAFVDIEPIAVATELEKQGLLNCSASGVPLTVRCEFGHPQVRPLLERYLPVPEGVTPQDFLDCLECYAALIDPIAWQTAPGFAAEFEERISEPATHAVAMLADASYLTRLYTLISPHEMLSDPLFHATSSLANVDSNVDVSRVNSCDDAPSYVELGDGQLVALEDEVRYPQFETMPSALRIERVPTMGPAQVETDNLAATEDIIADYNRGKLVGPSPWSCTIAKLGSEALLSMLALFGLAWLQRAPRAARRTRS